MNFLRGLLAARSHLAFLVGIAAAMGVVRLTSRLTSAAPRSPAGDAALLARAWPLRERGPLSPREREMARAAWLYFGRNTNERTGLAGSVDGYPSTTMWELGSQLLAVLAARDLGLVTRADARARLERALSSMASLPLGEQGLPNKAYDTRTLAMVDYANRPAPNGIGWSALDIGRAFVPLSLIVRREPELTPLVEGIAGRWNLAGLSDGASLRGATRRPDGALEVYQEGRLGYEQYAAKALLPWGVPAAEAIEHRAHIAFTDVGGQLVPHDDRLPRDHGGTHNAVLSEPWVLEGLEHGFDASSVEFARAVLAAQERRSASTGKLTAVSEDAIDRPPGFAYSAVLNGSEAWTAFSPDGTPAPAHLTFSTKAAVGWAALFDGPYPRRLFEAAADLVAPGRGLYAGRYDATGTVNRALSLNTHAVVLEALAYRMYGPFFRRAGPPPASMPSEAEVRR
jgi:hypothetical protein